MATPNRRGSSTSRTPSIDPFAVNAAKSTIAIVSPSTMSTGASPTASFAWTTACPNPSGSRWITHSIGPPRAFAYWRIRSPWAPGAMTSTTRSGFASAT